MAGLLRKELEISGLTRVETEGDFHHRVKTAEQYAI